MKVSLDQTNAHFCSNYRILVIFIKKLNRKYSKILTHSKAHGDSNYTQQDM